jgi:putative thiamine transport system permease protein
MAAPLRYPLILLAWGTMAAIYLPLLPAAGELVGAALPGPLAGAVRRPAAGPGAGRHPRLHAAVRRRRAADRPDHRRRPLAFGPLAAAGFPSAAAAGGAPSCPGDGGAAAVRRRGWLWQRLPFLTPPVDRYGIGLGLTMALKESAFVLWVIYGLLGRNASPTRRPR